MTGEYEYTVIETGDKIRTDIPDKDDPDYRYHGKHGEIIDVKHDDAVNTPGMTEIPTSTVFG